MMYILDGQHRMKIIFDEDIIKLYPDVKYLFDIRFHDNMSEVVKDFKLCNDRYKINKGYENIDKKLNNTINSLNGRFSKYYKKHKIFGKNKPYLNLKIFKDTIKKTTYFQNGNNSSNDIFKKIKMINKYLLKKYEYDINEKDYGKSVTKIFYKKNFGLCIDKNCGWLSLLDEL